MGLTSVSSSDDDIRDVSNSTSTTSWSTQTQSACACTEREPGSTLVKYGAGPFILKTTGNLIKVSKGGSN